MPPPTSATATSRPRRRRPSSRRRPRAEIVDPMPMNSTPRVLLTLAVTGDSPAAINAG